MSDAPIAIRIGLVSDTHAVYDEELNVLLKGVQHILHAGDIGHKGSNPEDVLSKLNNIAPTLAVRGNVDSVASHIPDFRLIRHCGWKLLLLHIAGMPPRTATACQELIGLHHPDIVVFGHSHKHGACQHDGVLYINPGSAGPARFKLARSIAILKLPDKVPNAQLSTDVVEFHILAAHGHRSAATKQGHKRKRNGL